MDGNATPEFGLEFRPPESSGVSSGEFHMNLVFQQYQRVLESLSEEMIPGFWEEKKDKLGNSLMIFHRDTRRVAMERIMTLKNVLSEDLRAKDLNENVNKILEQIKKKKDEWENKQKAFWIKLNNRGRQNFMKNNTRFEPDFFNSDSPFYHEFLNEAMTIYRLLFEVLERCCKDKKYFGRGMRGA